MHFFSGPATKEGEGVTKKKELLLRLEKNPKKEMWHLRSMGGVGVRP